MTQDTYKYRRQNPTDDVPRNAEAESDYDEWFNAELRHVCERAKDAGYTDEEINAALNSAVAKLFYCL